MSKLVEEIPVRWNNEIIGYTLDSELMSGAIRVTNKKLWKNF